MYRNATRRIRPLGAHSQLEHEQPSVECFQLRHSFCVDQQKKTRYENSIRVEHTCATAAEGSFILFFIKDVGTINNNVRTDSTGHWLNRRVSSAAHHY